MKHFMSNSCGFERCHEWECERCNYFKPRFLGIPVPRKIGEWVYNLEEYLFFQKYVIEDDEHIDWLEEEE